MYGDVESGFWDEGEVFAVVSISSKGFNLLNTSLLR